MEREELLEQVNAELGETRLTLSERTINEELDDMLEEFGDDAEANSKLVKRIATRLKRMDGNLHSDVSAEVKKWKQANKPKPKQEPHGTKEDDDETPDYIKKLNARLDAMEEARKREQADKAKNAIEKSVKESLTAKMKDAGLEVNAFFLKTAMQKVHIPDEDADVAELVEKLEKQYNADLKEAGVENKKGKPARGEGLNGKSGSQGVDDYFAKKAKREGWSKDKK